MPCWLITSYWDQPSTFYWKLITNYGLDMFPVIKIMWQIPFLTSSLVMLWLYASHTNFHLSLFFDLIPCSLILISFRLHDASAFYYVFLILLPTTSITPSSVLHPSSTILSSITLSLHHPHSCPLSSVTLSPLLFVSLSSNSLPLHPILLLSSQHLLITPCLPVLTSSTLHSVPCDSVSHFLHSPYYPTCLATPSIVVYKSFWLVVYSLACNCHPLLPTQSPPFLPQSPTNLVKISDKIFRILLRLLIFVVF